MLSLQNINVTFGQRKILNDFNLQVAGGEFLVITGSNGAGKSTMFNIISGFLTPDSGEVTIDGQNLASISPKSRAKIVSKVMQDPKMGSMENMTIFENMAFAYKRGETRALVPFEAKARRLIFAEKLSILEMGLENRLDELVANLSGGQRQALSLIMAIVTKSRILLLDEITAALDPTSAEKVMILANKIVRDEKRTCIMITHNMTHAKEYGDRKLVLEGGRLT
ncbi:MAG: ATP-binding cassette domain-containing protein [Pseudomonadota bacterium]